MKSKGLFLLESPQESRVRDFLKSLGSLGYNTLFLEPGEDYLAQIRAYLEEDPVLFVGGVRPEDLAALGIEVVPVALSDTLSAPDLAEQVEASLDYADKTVVSAVLMAEDGKVLLVKKRGRWILPGGTLEEGEESRETLVREIHEETGLDVLEGEMEYKYKMYLKDRGLLWLVYFVPLPGKSDSLRPQVHDREEGIGEVRWFRLGEALSLVPRVTREILGRLRP